MNELNSTLLSVILILAAGLIGVIIVVMIRIAKTVSGMQAEIQNLTRSLVPLVERMNTLAQSADETLAMVNANRDAFDDSVASVRKMAKNIAHLQQIVQDQIEPPLLQFASVLSGVRQGVQSFFDQWRRSH